MAAMRDTIDRDERSPDMAASFAAKREHRTGARDVKLAPDALETNHEEARPVAHAHARVTVASLLDRHLIVTRHLRPALAAE